jgi:hypothetical protein
MRVFAAVVAVSLIAVPSAAAKIKLSLSVATSPVQTGKPVVVFLRAAVPLDFDLKLIAVAPGRSWYGVVGVVTGDSRIAKATIPRDGFLSGALHRIDGAPWSGSRRLEDGDS